MIFTPEMCDLILRDLKTSTIRRTDKITTQRLKVGKVIAVCPGRGKFAVARVEVTGITGLGAYGGLDELSYEQIKRDGIECPPHENAWSILRQLLGKLNRCNPDEWAWKLIEFKRVYEPTETYNDD